MWIENNSLSASVGSCSPQLEAAVCLKEEALIVLEEHTFVNTTFLSRSVCEAKHPLLQLSWKLMCGSFVRSRTSWLDDFVIHGERLAQSVLFVSYRTALATATAVHCLLQV